jgi:hypothetical protein
MRAHQAKHRIATMSRVLGVSSSGYYAWLFAARIGSSAERCFAV